MTADFLFTWLMVFFRTTGVIMQLPMIAGRTLPAMARLGLCLCLATLLTSVVPGGTLPPGWGGLVVAAIGEVLLGLTMGFVARLAFTAVEMAGRLMSTEIGLTASPGIGAPEPSSEPVAALLSAFAVVLFFGFGAHEVLLGALARSFRLAVAGAPMFDRLAGETLIFATGNVLELGLRIAAPFIAMNFLVTLAFSVLGRVVPKMNVFILSFSARAFLGLGLLGAAGALLARYMLTEFNHAPLRALELLPVR